MIEAIEVASEKEAFSTEKLNKEFCRYHKKLKERGYILTLTYKKGDGRHQIISIIQKGKWTSKKVFDKRCLDQTKRKFKKSLKIFFEHHC